MKPFEKCFHTIVDFFPQKLVFILSEIYNMSIICKKIRRSSQIYILTDLFA